MQSRLIAPALAVFAAFLAAPAARAAAIPWSPSYQTALTHAKAAHSLMMVDVYTDWCVWCKKLDSDVYPDPAVVKAAAQFCAVKVNAEKGGQQIAARYKVNGYPTILFLDANGTLVGKIGGYEPAPQFAAELDRIADDYRQYPLLQAKVKADPTDMDSTLKLAVIETGRGQIADAQALSVVLEKNGQGAKLEPLYLGLGHALADNGQTANAVAIFQKALSSATSVDDMVAARIGLIEGDSALQQTDQVKLQLQGLIATPGITDDLKQRAQAMLDQMNSPTAK